MVTTVLHKASERGHQNHGWLIANHSFSFANWYDPTRVHFGMLRVLNDDIIAAGRGFGMHPHDNMEIVTIPLQGSLQHKDSMGFSEVVSRGEIQVMSAGTGVFHSEWNPSPTEDAHTLQTWVFPNKKNVEPRYQQLTFNPEDRKNKIQQIVSPNPEDDGAWVHQDAWYSWCELDKNTTVDYTIKRNGNGVYVFVIDGSVNILETELQERDAIGVSETETFTITATSNCFVLLIDVPIR